MSLQDFNIKKLQEADWYITTLIFITLFIFNKDSIEFLFLAIISAVLSTIFYLYAQNMISRTKIIGERRRKNRQQKS